jgi:type I restriction enzyme, S subunit
MDIVPAELDGALVSNDFPLFNLHTDRLLPLYFEWLSRTPGFVELGQRGSEGTTNRVRLKEDRFLALEIHLPPLAEQRRVVARIEELSAKIDEACWLRQGATQQAEALILSRASNLFERRPRVRGSARRIPRDGGSTESPLGCG